MIDTCHVGLPSIIDHEGLPHVLDLAFHLVKSGDINRKDQRGSLEDLFTIIVLFYQRTLWLLVTGVGWGWPMASQCQSQFGDGGLGTRAYTEKDINWVPCSSQSCYPEAVFLGSWLESTQVHNIKKQKLDLVPSACVALEKRPMDSEPMPTHVDLYTFQALCLCDGLTLIEMLL